MYPILVNADGSVTGQVKGAKEALAVFFTLSNLPTAEVGARVRAWRKLAGLSQGELAALASRHLPEEHRLSQSDISRLETRPGSVKFPTMVAVCKAFSRSISDLLEEMPEAVSDSGIGA